MYALSLLHVKVGVALDASPTIPVTGDKLLHEFDSGNADQRYPRFSPDGKWVAYSSNESGNYNVIVQSFPDGAHQYQLSNQGGLRPQRRSDAQELLCLSLDGKLMAAGVRLGTEFEWQGTTALFSAPIDIGMAVNDNISRHRGVIDS